ncbi:MAG TPA: type II toxin-antitoxin system VapC family toxin, partial [Tepidisphaeraceae bacterium]|nr:type II toxin-antitoxin system VapC family toxin [Tepidisphaeraceae bacterium]
MLFDSNIVIYAADPGHGSLRDWMLDQSPAVSAITYIEVFGFPGITTGEERALRAVFAALDVLPVTDAVIEQAAALRRQRRMSLGDAV